jgi:hypothetical protein
VYLIRGRVLLGGKSVQGVRENRNVINNLQMRTDIQRKQPSRSSLLQYRIGCEGVTFPFNRLPKKTLFMFNNKVPFPLCQKTSYMSYVSRCVYLLCICTANSVKTCLKRNLMKCLCRKNKILQIGENTAK